MPIAVEELMIIGVSGLTVSVNVAVPVPPAFVALKVMLEIPTTFSVPEINPVAVLIVKPDGKPTALKLVGLFVAVIG